VIWASPSHITFAIWVTVRVTGDANITSQGHSFGNGDAHIRGDITVTPARKANRIGLLTTRKNVDFDAISV